MASTSVYNAILESTKQQLGGSTYTVSSSIPNTFSGTSSNISTSSGIVQEGGAETTTYPTNVAEGGKGYGGEVNITYVLPDGTVLSTASGTIATTPSGGSSGTTIDKNTIIIFGVGFLIVIGLVLALG